jgi:hypothetical protein
MSKPLSTRENTNEEITRTCIGSPYGIRIRDWFVPAIEGPVSNVTRVLFSANEMSAPDTAMLTQ